jgi:hypothetical protein
LQLYVKHRPAADIDESRSVPLHLAISDEILTHIMKNAGGALVGREDDPVVHPLPFSPGRHDARPAQKGEVPRDPRLRHLQDFDEEAHANLILSHQIDQSEAVAVGKRDEEFFQVEFSASSAHNPDIIPQNTFALTNIFFPATLISGLGVKAQTRRTRRSKRNE